jgi:hypothetical protein
LQKLDHNISFLKYKTQILCRKFAKIAESCDHSIDPLSTKTGESGKEKF